jgi:hypothetical protein
MDKGIIEHGDKEYPSEHPALVSAKLWDEANEAIKPEKTESSKLQRRDKHVHLLKGLLKCGHCGTSLTPYPSGKKDANGQPYLYYTCTHVSKDGGASECPVRSIPARAFEELILGYLGEIGRHPEIIEASICASNDAKIKAVRPLKSKLASLNGGTANFLRPCGTALKSLSTRARTTSPTLSWPRPNGSPRSSVRSNWKKPNSTSKSTTARAPWPTNR